MDNEEIEEHRNAGYYAYEDNEGTIICSETGEIIDIIEPCLPPPPDIEETEEAKDDNK